MNVLITSLPDNPEIEQGVTKQINGIVQYNYAMISYLAQLTERILPGVLQEKPERRDELRAYFLAALDKNGGFRGRKGNGDLYYSAFALRGLFMLGMLDDQQLLARVAGFLDEQQRREDLSPADILSWTFCTVLVNTVQGKELLPEQTTALLHRWEHFRRSDGCFAASEKSAVSSTYTTFLTAIFYELIGESERSRMILIEPILARQRSDGGFVELPPLQYSGTNPTAAAVGLLTLLEVSLPEKSKTVDFLRRCQHSTGGFQAHARIPVPDLLSSFSALTALYDLNAAEQVNQSALRNFVTSLRSPDGGFFGMPLDQQSDVEYTFYGMALEAMLERIQNCSGR
jgi:geranylgeranyl transferase type-2 subunit beta